MAIRLLGVVFTVRLIGPTDYGIYAGAAAYVLLATVVAQMGNEIYLIRQPGEVARHTYDEAFTFLLVTSIVVSGIALGLTFAAGPLLRPVGVLVPLRVLLLSVPINVLWAPAQAAIERQFRYRRMGFLELSGDVVLYGTAIPLALGHAGAWSLVAGNFAWQSWLLVGSLVLSGLRPRLRWSGDAMRAFARHGLTFSASSMLGRLGGLVNPLVVGSFAGASGVGYVAFALRLVDTVGFAQRGGARLATVAFSKISNEERARLRYSVEEGSLFQLLAAGVAFAGFALGARWIIPGVFGHEWTRAISVYTLLALAFVCNAAGSMQMTLLLSRGRNLAVAGAVAVQELALAAAAVPLVRAFGVEGFGIAALIALVDLLYLDRMARSIVSFSYRRMAPFALAILPLVLFPLVPLPWCGLLALPGILTLFVPAMRSEQRRVATVVASALGRSVS